MADDIRPWDRQPGEASKAYSYFVTYRDMGAGRTLQAVAEEVAKSPQYIRTVAARDNWTQRVAAWDSMPGRAVSEAYEDMARRVAEQHERLATKLTTRLERNLDLMPEGADPSIKWSTAHGAARQGHAFATDLSKPKDTAREEISKQIAALISKLAGED